MGKGEKMREMRREKNLEGYLSDRSRKRLCEKIKKKIVMENEKERKLKEEYSNYLEIYKIVKEGNQKNRHSYIRENMGASDNILSQIDEMEE